MSYSDAYPVNTATVSTDATASTAPIEINDAETLGMIGRNSSFPLNGKYQQTADIVVTKEYQSIGNDTHPFTGEYDGQRHTISGLSDCLVDTLKQGSIRHLRFNDTHINSAKTTGLAACTVDGTVSDIRAENVHISTSGDNAHAGIGGGSVSGTVANTKAVNSTVKTSGENALAGIGGGDVGYGATVANTTAVNCKVETSGKNVRAGFGAGRVFDGGMVGNPTVVNSRIAATKENSGSTN
ncbi:hypothetical protein, partial [Endozoicomonas acroporae]|uniref:hypothetical protein n=1 Tax=Endozoicomonas acroporae TaxID=1701104 RepID=UPI0019D5768F